MNSSQDANPKDHPVYNSDEIDLRQLVRALWHYRWIIIVLGVLGVLGGAAASLLSTRYLSEGLVLTPRLTLGNYKQYEVALGSRSRLRAFLETGGWSGTRTEALLTRLVEIPGELTTAVKPVFSVTGRDAKTYDIFPTADKAGDLVGIQLSLARAEIGDDAPLEALAEYLRGTAVQVDLKGYVLDQCLVHRTREQELRNLKLDAEFRIQQQKERIESLRDLISRVPGAANVDSRQVVSLDKASERFLSPTAQLVAAEVAILDLGAENEERERARIAAGLRKSYYCAARELLDQPGSGRDFLVKLGALRVDVFKDKDMADEAVEFTSNAIEIEHEGWNSRYLEQMRFVVAPEGSEKRVRRPPLSIGVLLGGILGGLFGILVALILAWWHDNRREILAVDE